MNITNQCSNITYLDIITKEGEEIIKSKISSLKPRWTKHVARKIQIALEGGDCLVKINGEDEILIKEKYGLILEYEDINIESLITLTPGVSLYCIIAY